MGYLNDIRRQELYLAYDVMVNESRRTPSSSGLSSRDQVEMVPGILITV